jgi:uncharacterized protein (DUF1501 family)
MATLKRREFLASSALAAGGLLLTSRVAFARAQTSSRFVFVVLRGGLDGLSAVPPYADPDYARLRRELALSAPGTTGGVLKLDETFGLHPSLRFLHDSFSARELIVFHAIASPYRERSHFDAQDVLENGHVRPHASQTGWLNRALAALPSASSAQSKELGVAIGQNVPLVMRGPAAVASWSPSRLAGIDEDTLDRIADLYANDALLSKRLADALESNAIATQGNESGQDHGEGMLARRQKGRMRAAARYPEIIRAAANFLKREDGPRVAVFDVTGWDTHANQGAAQGQLALRLAALDSGLRQLKEQLGPVWRETAVMIATEFGRTAAANGTRGTDHGTAGAAFLLGGAVQGGRVIADWPGLSTRALHEQRDLKPTLDVRSALKGVLAEHLQIPNRALESSVFPESKAARPLSGLTRA